MTLHSEASDGAILNYLAGTSDYGDAAAIRRIAALVGAMIGGGSPEGVLTGSVGALYTDSTNGVLYIKATGTGNTGWTTVGGGGGRKAYVAKTGTYTATSANHVIDCTSGTFTVTLPTAVSDTGREFVLKNSGTGVLTIATTSSQTIDGSTTRTLNQYDSLTVVSNGANWIVI